MPASAPERYLPVYPPTAAVLFAPFARVSYETALTLWTMLLIGGYAAIVAVVWHRVRDVLPDRVFIAAAAAAFPPFWNLVLFGQTTIVPLLAFTLAWLALERGRPWLAGLALGLLSIKPQFARVLAGVAILTGQWRLVAGGAVSLLAQAGVVAHVLGTDALYAYVDTMRGIPAVEPLLEPNAYRMHSVRSVTNLLPHPVSTLV